MPEQWYQWINSWCTQILNKLKDQDKDQVVEILLHMLELVARKRWPAYTCLVHGFGRGLFKRRVADGLIVCKQDPEDLILPIEEGEEGANTPTAALSLLQAQGSIDPDATIVLESP